MPKYSIITPNFNGYSLMSCYFKSMENQIFKDFELIIVDDCSTDNSFFQLKEYAKKSDLNIKVFQTEKNAGPGNARNIGMDHVSGEFITFVDNDDWVKDNWLLDVDNVLVRHPEIHCVIYDYYIKTKDKETISRSMYKGEEGKVPLTECMIYARNHTFGKFYKLTDCMGIRFPKLRRCEDVAFVCRAIEACGTVYYLKKPYYYYYQRNESLSNNKNMDEADMVQAFSIIEKSLGSKYPSEIKEKSVTDLLYGSLLMMAKSNKSGKDIKEYINNYEVKYPEWWECKIVNEVGQAKKLFLMCAKRKNVLALKLLARVHDRGSGIISLLSKL